MPGRDSTLRIDKLSLILSRHVGLSPNPGGCEDSELNIQGLPSISVGDYKQASTSSQLILIPGDTSDTITVESAKRSYYTARERLQGINEMEEDEAEVITDSGDARNRNVTRFIRERHKLDATSEPSDLCWIPATDLNISPKQYKEGITKWKLKKIIQPDEMEAK
jgi:hypothetical protein